jgi:hypothetical protein
MIEHLELGTIQELTGCREKPIALAGRAAQVAASD